MTGLMVPLYIYPNAVWDKLIVAKKAHPNVPIVVVLNSNNGPGASFDTNYATYIAKMVEAGIICYAYVWCGETNDFDGRDCTKDVANWEMWYPQITGAFIDGFHGGYAYTGDLQLARARAAGYYPIVGNPGMAIPSNLLTGVDIACVYETSGQPSLATMQNLANTYGAHKVYILAYNVPELNAELIEQSLPYCRWMYVTNDTLNNPWDTLPPYIDGLVAALDNIVVPPVVDTHPDIIPPVIDTPPVVTPPVVPTVVWEAKKASFTAGAELMVAGWEPYAGNATTHFFKRKKE